ncbi:high-affinity Zn(2+) transporter zrt1 [Aphanomyces cochlioides]|nr:high-affinity Zn(2+) transporter zrt1 [Aphanomyces cochlioides]
MCPSLCSPSRTIIIDSRNSLQGRLLRLCHFQRPASMDRLDFLGIPLSFLPDDSPVSSMLTVEVVTIPFEPLRPAPSWRNFQLFSSDCSIVDTDATRTQVRNTSVSVDFVTWVRSAMSRNVLICLFLLLGLAVAKRAHGSDVQDDDKSLCGSVQKEDDYDHPLHTAAVFIVLGVSLLGSFLPVLSSYIAWLRNNRPILDILNAFGIGIVVSTACIHMIPTAIETLANKCLNLSYDCLAMVIVLATILLMQVTETELTLKQTNGFTDEDKFLETYDPVVSSSGDLVTQPSHQHHHHHVDEQTKAAARRKIHVFIFEVGVAIHSVIIGLELGVATGSSFTTLLTAICFHQFFEGVAVGSSAVSAFSTIRSSILTALVYSLSTPIGIAIGIGIHSTYSETSTTSLWVRGILDAMAGGILIYTGLVELLTYQYTINGDFHRMSSSFRTLCYICVWMGACAMAIVGEWA